MSARDFWQKSRWLIISGFSFLVLFALVVGILSYGIDVKINRMNEQLAQMSASISSLEKYSPEMKNSIDGAMEKIDGISQKIDFSTADSSAEDALETMLNDVLRDLSGLSQKIEDLKDSVEAQRQAAQNARTTASIVTIPDAPIAGGTPVIDNVSEPDEEDNPEQETADENTDTQVIAAGEVFTVTVQANEVSDLYGYQFNLNYENQKAAYEGALRSSVDGISTIFKKDMPDHLLVGATMIGDMLGYTGEGVEICSMKFVATENVDPASFTIDGVSTVDSSQKYVEDIAGWQILLKAQEKDPDIAE